MSKYKPHSDRDAKAFDILQNMKPETAQSFFWNFSSRTERREAILAWKANDEMNDDCRCTEFQMVDNNGNCRRCGRPG